MGTRRSPGSVDGHPAFGNSVNRHPKIPPFSWSILNLGLIREPEVEKRAFRAKPATVENQAESGSENKARHSSVFSYAVKKRLTLVCLLHTSVCIMNIMSSNQYSLLAILGENPRREYHLHEMGRIIGKKPGVFQRGINSLEKEGLIISIALIYGSYARNKMRADSDVDLLIVTDDPKAEDILVEALDGIERTFQREVNYRIYDREDFGRKRRSGDPFLQEVLSGEHIALKGSS